MYRAGNEVDVVEVVDETKLIAGVQCIVVRDLVSRDGNLAEATDDWYVPAKNGETWYFGEEVKNSETFAGDDPQRPELVSARRFGNPLYVRPMSRGFCSPVI